MKIHEFVSKSNIDILQLIQQIMQSTAMKELQLKYRFQSWMTGGCRIFAQILSSIIGGKEFVVVFNYNFDKHLYDFHSVVKVGNNLYDTNGNFNVSRYKKEYPSTYSTQLYQEDTIPDELRHRCGINRSYILTQHELADTLKQLKEELRIE